MKVFAIEVFDSQESKDSSSKVVVAPSIEVAVDLASEKWPMQPIKSIAVTSSVDAIQISGR